MKAGQKVHEQIDAAIQSHDRLLLVLSSASMSSQWVKSEIADAREKEVAQERRVLFPISVVPFEVIRSWKLFDADRGSDSARETRSYFIPDFSEWHDEESFKSSLARLLRDLRDQSAGVAQGQSG